jgi:pyrophosphatase PpaX
VRSSLPPARVRLAGLEGILFDFDGTLIDTTGLILESFRVTAREFLDEQPPDDVLLAGVGIPLRTQMEALSPGRGDEMVAFYRAHNHAHHDELARPYPHVEEVLSELSVRGMPMAVVTSKGRAAVDLGVRMIGLERHVQRVFTSDDVEIHKPDPHPLRHAAGELGLDLTRCIYLGDSPHDMAAARDGGAIAVAALWGMFERGRVLAERPDYALEDIDELPALIDGDAERFEC